MRLRRSASATAGLELFIEAGGLESEIEFHILLPTVHVSVDARDRRSDSVHQRLQPVNAARQAHIDYCRHLHRSGTPIGLTLSLVLHLLK